MTPCVGQNGTRFRVWAPRADSVALRIFNGRGDERPMEHRGDGFYEQWVPGLGAGCLYKYVLDGEAFPDPAAAFQPQGVHGPSEVVDFSAFAWTDQSWQGLGRDELVIYELHIGTFTESGTLVAAVERLDELVELGINAVELMPLADFPGKWNWGYDGVALFAPSHNYGDPEALHRFVDACHARGLAVLLDVVYNHLGPEGNYLSKFGPYFGGQQTPWGKAPQFSGPHAATVRKFFRSNARHWVEHYHFDGLRFDAIGAIPDGGEDHIINEIGRDLHRIATETGRQILAFGESNLFDPDFLPTHGGSMDALWLDDSAHAALSLATGESHHGGRSYNGGLGDLLESLQRGYLYRRQEDGAPLREAQDGPPADRLAIIHQIQNHDIVGNSPGGLRLHQRASAEVQRALAALVLLYPAVPLLFMGEEFAADSPFLFFTDFGDSSLRRGVEQGRRREFPQKDWSRAVMPTDPEAFFNSRLPPANGGDPVTRRWYQDCLRLRRDWRRAGLLDPSIMTVEGCVEDGFCQLLYADGDETAFVLCRPLPSGDILEFEGVSEVLHLSGTVRHHGDRIALGPATAVVGRGRPSLRPS